MALYMGSMRICTSVEGEMASGSDKNAVMVSGLNTVPSSFNLDITSEKEYSLDTIKYLHVLTKSKTGNAYGLIDVQLWKDSRNYMRFGCWGSYVVNFKLVINNQTIVSQDLGSTHDMDNYTDILTEMDMVINKVKVYGAKAGTNPTLLYSFDFSQYDYSALDTFYIKSSLCRWGGGNIFNQSIYINNKTDYTQWINFHYRYGEYNAIPQLVYPEQFSMATSVKGGDLAGSTVIQTYSPTHKLIDVNMASENHFPMGTYSSTYTAKTAMMYTKFRVTEITTSCRLTRGAGSAGNYFFDYDTGEFVAKDTLTPELNKWYLLVEDVTNAVAYTSTYGVKAVGQFKLENEGMFVSSVQSQNINAETCRGLYFTGPIPFNTENTKWEIPTFASNEAGRVVPIGTLYIPADGNISMYNGTAWKVIGT